MASSSRFFGKHPDGYGPEPQLNREEILAAVTDFVFGCTHCSVTDSLTHSLVVLVVVVVTIATHSSTAIRCREIGVSVATASQAAR